MRYERRAGGASPGGPRHLRVVAALACAAAVSATVLGVVLAGTGSGAHPGERASAQGRAAARAFTRAAVLGENLGSPPPRGVTGAGWALRGDPLVGPADHPRLARPERDWRGPRGAVAALDGAAGAAIASGQGALVDELFAGRLRAETRRELLGLVRGEEVDPPRIASPGGARVLRWLSEQVEGRTAEVEAVVEEWSEVDHLVERGGRLGLASSVARGEVDARAKLRLDAGRWRLVALDTAPWQEAT